MSSPLKQKNKLTYDLSLKEQLTSSLKFHHSATLKQLPLDVALDVLTQVWGACHEPPKESKYIYALRTTEVERPVHATSRKSKKSRNQNSPWPGKLLRTS